MKKEVECTCKIEDHNTHKRTSATSPTLTLLGNVTISRLSKIILVSIIGKRATFLFLTTHPNPLKDPSKHSPP